MSQFQAHALTTKRFLESRGQDLNLDVGLTQQGRVHKELTPHIEPPVV